MNAPVFFESAGDERATPQDFFDQLDKEFHFDIDCAASPQNHKCDLYFGEGGIADDALEADWGGPGTTCFLNPPYSVAGAFVAKAREEADKGAVVVLLLPVRSDTKWWHKFIYDKAGRTYYAELNDLHGDGDFREGVRVRFLPGRLNFELHVEPKVRSWIKAELGTIAAKDEDGFTEKVKALVKVTGLPKMAIERINEDQPDDCLLDSAPFPSCVVIFSKVD